MASTASTEASEIRRRGRQRLIGAVAIAVLLVVFVPMILDSEPRSDHAEPSLTIPSKDKVEPLPAPAKSRTPPVEASKAADAVPKAAEAPAVPAPAPDAPKAVETPPKAAPQPVPQPAPKAAVAAAPKLEGFAVQVGAFKDEAKLTQARDKLVAAKIPHYIERRNTSAGELTRLRAGPYPTREAAEKALAAMKAASIDGKVVPLP
jgi:DedD protein